MKFKEAKVFEFLHEVSLNDVKLLEDIESFKISGVYVNKTRGLNVDPRKRKNLKSTHSVQLI